MASLDYKKARRILEEILPQAELALIQESPPLLDLRIVDALHTIFSSKTQAYREVFLGCTVAKILDDSINIRQPYINQGPKAFNGRTLDEKVINPFLHDKRIPASRGPYLSVFRRSIQFDQSTRAGLRDQEGYDALLALIDYLESISGPDNFLKFLQYLLYEFLELREKGAIPLYRPQRLSLDQYEILISGLLSTPSGGRLPVLLVVAAFQTIKNFFELKDWNIAWQGINVADTASGVGGDVTITRGDQTMLAVEVTERTLDRSRIVATFNTKIAPGGIEDYLFFLKNLDLPKDVYEQAQKYFAQGHEMNFVSIKDWILMILASVGKPGREIFLREFLGLLEEPGMPQFVKVAWNDQLSKIIG